MGDPGRLPVHDAELEPQTPCSGRNRLAGMRDAQLRAPEHVDHVERTARLDRLGDRPERRHAEDRRHVRVDRNAIEPLVEQESEDPERRSVRIVRGADDRDPARRRKHPRDPGVVEHGHRPAALLEVQEGGRAVALLACQVAASRSYGCPSAAGGMLRPTKPGQHDDRDEVRQGIEELAGDLRQRVAEIAASAERT